MLPPPIVRALCALPLVALGLASRPSALLPTTDEDVCSAVHASSGERLRLTIVPTTNPFASGDEVRARVDIDLFTAAAELRVETRGTGVLARAERSTTVEGPWSAGARTSVDVTARPSGQGTGELRIAVFALDASGGTIQGRVALLFVHADEDGTWTSGASRVDLEFRRLDALGAAQRLTGAQLAAQRAAISRAVVTLDFVAEPERPFTPVEARIQDALGRDAALAPPLPGDGTAELSVTAVRGIVSWRDANAGAHPCPMAEVEVLDGATVLGSTSTDAAGNYLVLLPTDDTVDVTLRASTRSAVANVRPDASGAATYSVESTPFTVTGGTIRNADLTIGNVTTAEVAFGVHAALVLIGAYTSSLTGGLPSTVDVHFPTNGSGSYFSGSNREIHITLLDRYDWDVIHHEYGHLVMNVHGFVNSPGGSHNFNTNLAAQPGLDKDKGTRLAWGEGWPTFFGISGQTQMGGRGLGIPHVGDPIYFDGEDRIPALAYHLDVNNGRGEDDELSVAAGLWDLWDDDDEGFDQFTRPDTTLFELFEDQKPIRMGEAWDALASVLSTRSRAQAGGPLANVQIAPRPLTPPDRYRPAPTPPEFTWLANGGGAPNPLNDFKIVFYDKDFDGVLLEVELGDTTSYTPTQFDWDQIRAGDEIVHWVVEGKSTAGPETPGGTVGAYWSPSRQIGGVAIAFVIDDTESMVEEIDAVKLALNRFIDELATMLAPGEEPPTIQVVTFKDSVSQRIVSSDLDAVRAEVDSLTATAGLDCPESGAHAVEFVGSALGTGGTVLFASDAAPHPGVDLGAVIAELQAKGVAVQVILSGDCLPAPLLAYEAGGRNGRSLGATTSGVQGDAGVVGSWVDPSGDVEGKPGDDDPSQGPLIDPGQAPIDDHGDSAAGATLIGESAPWTFGSVTVPDLDFLAMELEEGRPYAVRFVGYAANPVVVQVIAPDTTTVIGFASTSTSDLIAFEALETGRHYVRLSSIGSSYAVGYREDPYPFLTNGVEVYSTLAAETGGVFAYQDGVNAGETTEYVASLLNVMLGAIGPAVLTSSPSNLPRDASFTLSLSGNRTSWTDATVVDVLAAGVTVDAVRALSSTRLEASVTIDAGATLGFADVLVSTPVGAGVEQARGIDVVEVVATPAGPTLITMQPTGATRGDALTLSFFGVGTAWDTTTTVDLGADVAIASVVPVSPTRLDVQAQIASDATIGFRDAIVSTDGSADDVLARALFVFGSGEGAPRVVSVTPPRAPLGTRAVVTIEGADTSFVAGVTTADLGAGVQVVDVLVSTPRRVDVTVEVALDATLGARDVTLTTDGETVIATDAFAIDDFANVRVIDVGLAKLSEALSPYGTAVFQFEASATTRLERVFVAPFGDGASGTVPAPDVEASLLTPTGQVLWSARSSATPIDALDVVLPAQGTYRLVLVDRGGAGGTYKGIAVLSTDR